jgi:glutamate-1-semialdehyde 2,1-aminomutase
MNFQRSKQLFEEAKKYIPGGVNSPVRAFKSVGIDPVFMSRGKGSHIWDADGNEYIDYVGSWGPLILGHAHPEVVQALKETVEKGTSFGAPTELEVEMAKRVVEAVPSVEEVRMVSSGTEAVMSALRLARGYTGRSKIVKFEGCYHGHSDSVLVKAGSGVATLSLPDSPGVTKGAAEDTINLPYNAAEAVDQAFQKDGQSIAAVIVEPVAGNMGVVPAREGFLQSLRDITKKYGALLIFDEVITGFRVSYGGAQKLFNVMPDITCLGKTIGGGLPVGAFGGRRDIMEMVAPSGPIYQAGTLSGNPLAMIAGITTLDLLKKEGAYEKLEKTSRTLSEGLKQAALEAGVNAFFTRVGAMSCMFFTDKEVFDYNSAKTSSTDKYAAYFRAMLERGVYLAPSQFEATFISLSHSREDIEKTVAASRIALKEVSRL